MSKFQGAARRRLPAGLAFALAASAAVAITATSAPAGAVITQHPGTYVPIPAVNLLDTGSAIGVPTKTPVPGHATVTVQIAGRGSGASLIPATGVSAVAMTLAVTSTGSGYATVYPTDISRPGAASIDFAAGRTATNLAYAKLSAGGAISLYTGTSGTSRLYVNVSGYFVGGTATDAATYVPLPPANVLDTGTGVGTGGHVALVAAHTTVSVTVAGAGGVPVTGAASAALNVAVISTSAGGYLTAYATGQARPAAASVDFAAKSTTATLTTIGLSASGSVTFYNGSSAGVRVVANVFGYYRSGAASIPGSFVQVTPTNLYDSAVDGGNVPAHGTVDAATQSNAARAAAWTDGRSALVVAVAVVNPSVSGFLTAYSAQIPRPGAANLDFSPSQLTLNGAVVQVTDQGDVDLYNGSSGSIRAVVNLFGYYLDGPVSPLHWTGPTDLNPRTGFPNSVSCASVTFCAAVDGAGAFTTFNGTTWTTPVQPVHAGSSRELVSVSCAPATTFCVVMDQDGATYKFNGSTWATAGSIGWSNPATFSPQTLSCPTTTRCVAVNVDETSLFDGTSWSAPTALGGLGANGWIGSVSCVSATHCVAVGGHTASDGSNPQGISITFDGTSWSATTTVATSDYLAELSCIATTFCLAVSFSNQVAGYTGTAWTAARTITTEPFHFTDVSCASSAFCMVGYVDANNNARYQIFNGATWTADAPIGTAQHAGLACPSVGFCVEFDAQGSTSIYKNGAWSTSPVQVDPLGQNTASVSCRAAHDCVAVDSSGNAFTYNGTSWSKTIVDVANPLEWVSCTATICVGVGRNGSARVLTGSTWSARAVADPAGEFLSGVSCATATFCVAVGVNGDAITFNGSTWAAPVLVDAGALLTSVSCPTITFCAASDTRGGVYTFNGTSWSARMPTQPAEQVVIPEIWCTSSTFCVMADDAGVEMYDGTTWTAADAHIADGQPTTVMCTSPTFCVVVATGDEAVTFDGTQWSVPTRLVSGIPSPESFDRPESVFCTSSTACVLVNDETSWVSS
ncbi:MAG TPA: hypothetical protein VGN35_08760 [Jatrophihabitantaceae bacterium]|nr:hypothetical protein [Jatrophihabitantaceae bacterium]